MVELKKLPKELEEKFPFEIQLIRKFWEKVKVEVK